MPRIHRKRGAHFTWRPDIDALKCLCDLCRLSDFRSALRISFSREAFSIFCDNRIFSGVG
ncbi:hypothetical protein ACHAW5_009369 [Stephanodiscus triporus]|uniref:Uncharacterized protein n=1 Tax=Stephanodiscus triporus TaxID=2934178 RepID=A0ABD3P5N9_9STRA